MTSRRATFLAVSLLLAIENIDADRKSREKCKEYGKLVYSDETAPVLRIGGNTEAVSKCGIVETPLIVGGVRAGPQEFPHMALIGYSDPVVWQCGGSVVSANYVLTAAHCLESRDNGPALKIRVGLVDIKNPGKDMQERKIIDRIKHPGYQPPSRYHDIALLKLDEPLKLGPEVRPACLEVEASLQQKTAIACGFGKTSYEATNGSDHLMKVTLNYVSSEDCRNLFGNELGGPQMLQGLTSNMLCAGVMEGGKDTCQGDSGGPLQRVLEDPYCTYSIVGITSFGKFCAFKNSPAVYSKVSSYLDWIEGIVWP